MKFELNNVSYTYLESGSFRQYTYFLVSIEWIIIYRALDGIIYMKTLKFFKIKFYKTIKKLLFLSELFFYEEFFIFTTPYRAIEFLKVIWI